MQRLWRWMSISCICLGLGLVTASYGQVWWSDFWYWWGQRVGVVYSLDIEPDTSPKTVRLIQPVSTDFGLVIEKINVNEQIAAQIDPYQPGRYLPVLQQYGLAEAKGSVPPGQIGTTYLFGHSTINIWEIGRYHAPFTLLHKLEVGDRLTVFYQKQRYDYAIVETKVVSPSEVHYLTDDRTKPTLILQTCDPPGQNTKRLLIIAQIAVPAF